MRLTSEVPANALILTIRSESWKVKCNHPNCIDGRKVIKIDGSLECPKCHGTGTRSVHLEGWVGSPDPIITQRMGTDILEVSYPLINGGWGTKEQYRESVIDAWRARTLPDSVSAGLREVAE